MILRYLAATFALGFIAVWGSENLFWFAPPDDLTFAQWLLTWVAYSACGGAALSAVILTGLGGWRGAYLGGVVLGYLADGVLVDTIYDAFPFQLIWTAMAWHALFTSLVLVAGLRAAVHWPLWWHLALVLGIGVFGGVFGLFWVTERPGAPDLGALVVYLGGAGTGVPLAHMVLDRVGPIGRPRFGVIWIFPAIAAALWVIKAIAAPAPVKIAFPVVMGLTIWAMMRLGRGRHVPLSLGAPGPVWRHLLFLIAPVFSIVIVWPMWSAGIPFAGNIVVALVTVPLSLGLWVWLLAAGVRVRPEAR